ncbi:MAG: hypothetical protein Q9159_007430, partial [Coniocarpon cinnabarinum]
MPTEAADANIGAQPLSNVHTPVANDSSAPDNSSSQSHPTTATPASTSASPAGFTDSRRQYEELAASFSTEAGHLPSAGQVEIVPQETSLPPVE